MAKTLEYADTSAQTVKIGDTTTSFTMVLGEDSNPVDLTNATSIIAKLGNSTGYLRAQTVTSDNIPDPLSGKVIIKFDADFMSGLTSGYYLLEVWVTYDSGVAIYPSGDLTGFTINNNIESQSGSVITTISYDDFVKAMNKAASTIAKGDKGEKGDTGTVDNDGLTTAPAFVALQNQVNNSAVGTNLFSQSTATAGYIGPTGNVAVVDDQNERVSDYIPVSASSVYTFQMWGTTPSGRQYWYGIGSYDSNKNFISRPQVYGTKQTSDTTEHVSQTITTTSTTAYVRVSFSKYNDYKAKLEKGSVATDWCLSPSEILTQADYAKIKAAIVALGGSLS